MIYRTLRQDLTSAALGAAAIGALYLLLGWLLVGCQPYAAAWRTTAAVREAGTMTDRAIAAAVKHRATACKEVGGDIKACVRTSKEWRALTGWRAWGVPAVNSAIVATVSALQIAEQTHAKRLDWVALLKPAACAIVRVLRQWGPHLGKAREPVALAIAAFKGACR